MARHLARQQLRPAGVVVEVAHRQRHVGIARFADGLAVVQGFQHGEEPRVFLQRTRQRVEQLRAAVAAQRLPPGQRGGGGVHGAVHQLGVALRDRCQRFALGRVHAVEVLGAGNPTAVDEMAEAALVLRQPGHGHVGAFGGGAVVHGGEDVLQGGHGSSIQGIAWRCAAL